MKLPAVWLALAFIAGIAVERARPAGTHRWLFAAVLAMALAFLLLSSRRFLWPAWVVTLVAWCALGGLAASLERSSIPADNAARLVTQGQLDTSEPLRWRGRLRSDPLRLPWGVRYEIALEEVQNAAGAHPVSGGLRVNYFYNVGKRADLPPLRAGDRIEALVQARLPRNFLDPGAFDARGWLARQGIHLVGSLRSAELLTPLGTPPLALRHRLARWRGQLLERVDTLFPAAPARSAVLRAMLLGDRSFVDSDTSLAFQKTAAFHVLVLAGLHVAALAMFLFWVGRRLRLPLVVTTLLTLAALAAYVGVVQERPPILRAALMAAAFLLARLLFRRVELLNTVALAALALLIAAPSSLGDASFQLSFVAAGVIAGLALPWIDRSSGPYRDGLEHLGDVTRDTSHPPRVAQFRLDLRAAIRWQDARLGPRWAGRSPSLLTVPLRAGLRLWELVLLSATIQLGMLPLLALYFHRVSLGGPASNVPAVLLTGLIVPLGFLTVGASFIWSGLAAVLAKLLGVLVTALLASIEWFARWPHLSYRIPGPPGWLLFAFLAVIVLLVAAARAARHTSAFPYRAAEWLAGAALVVLAIAVATYPFAPRLEKGKLEVTVLDVGQGDSIFVAFPDGHTLLIDGGGLAGDERVGGYRTGTDVGEEVVSPYLWQRGLKRLDVVALSHAHHDHIEGLFAVLDNFRAGQLWVGRDIGSRAYEELMAESRSREVSVVHRRQGDAFEWGGVKGSVLWPTDLSTSPSAANDDSLVLRLEDGAIRFLLPGDIEKKVEAELVAQEAPLAAEFLKVPHHGSRTSSTSGFLAAVAPRAAVVSVGENNPFGHPNQQIVERYAEDGVHLLRTDRDGAVTASTDGRSLAIHSYAEAHPPQ
jgi:competence protein ComEC